MNMSKNLADELKELNRVSRSLAWCRERIDRTIAGDGVDWPQGDPEDVLWDANYPDIPSCFTGRELRAIQKFLRFLDYLVAVKTC